MLYNQPLYHQSPPALPGGYSTRILLGLLSSLSVVLLLLHLPFSRSPARVGWSTPPSDRILVSQVQHEEETASDSDETSSETESSAPPPTHHASSAPSAATKGAGKTPDGDQGKKTETQTSSQSSDDPSSAARSIATLSAEDTQPEIVGGRGALYLNLTYPPAAQKKGIEGRLTLQFTVDRDGNTHSIEITNSLHPLCDSAAVRALRSVTFRPATHAGDPIPIRMSLPVRFKLRSGLGPLRTTSTRSSGG